MKKILSVILSVCILCISCISSPVIFAADDSTVSVQKTKSVNILTGLGFLASDFDSSKNVTRSEFVDIFMKAMYPDYISQTSLPYKDISDKDSFYKSVASAYDMGFIGEDDSFLPDKEIKVIEAAKFLTLVLGYGFMSNISGSSITSYAAKAGLFDDLSVRADDSLTGDNMAKMIMNALEAYIVVETGSGSNISYKTSDDETLMKSVLDVYKSKGIVTGNDITDINGFSTTDDMVRIDGERYYFGKSGVDNLLGREVEFYYKNSKDDSYGTVLYAEKTTKNEEITVYSSDISETTTLTEFAYYEGNSTKTKAINSDTWIVYNGANDFGYTREQLMPEDGFVTMIDNDGDGRVNGIIITDYEIGIVGNINTENKTIYFKNGAGNINIDDAIRYKIKKNGQYIEYTALAEWDVLNYFKVNGTYIIDVSNDTVSGKVSGINTSANEITVDGTECKLSSKYNEAFGKIESGKSGIFYFSAARKIVAANFSTTQKKNYMIITGVYNDEAGDNTKGIVRFFDKSGDTERLNIKDRVKIDDNTYITEKAIAKLKNSLYQLVVVDADTNGNLKSIKYPIDKSDADDYAGYDDNNFTKDKSLDEVRFYQGWGGGMKLSDDMIVFSIPVDKTDISIYKAEGRDKIGTDDQTIDLVDVYDLNKFNQPSVLVINNFNKDTPAEAADVDLYDEWFVCTAIKDITDEDGVSRKQLCGYSRETYKEFMVAEGGAKNVSEMWRPDQDRMLNPTPNNRSKWGFLGYTSDDIAVGDVMQLGYNAKGDVNFFRMLYSAKLDGTDLKFASDGTYGGNDLVYYKPGEYYEIGENTPTVKDPIFMSMLYTAFGEVVSVDNDMFRYKTVLAQLGSGGTIEKHNVERVQQSVGSVYILHNGKKSTVTKGSTSDIMPGDKIFLHVRDMRCFYMLIIRD